VFNTVQAALLTVQRVSRPCFALVWHARTVWVPDVRSIAACPPSVSFQSCGASARYEGVSKPVVVFQRCSCIWPVLWVVHPLSLLPCSRCSRQSCCFGIMRSALTTVSQLQHSQPPHRGMRSMSCTMILPH